MMMKDLFFKRADRKAASSFTWFRLYGSCCPCGPLPMRFLMGTSIIQRITCHKRIRCRVPWMSAQNPSSHTLILCTRLKGLSKLILFSIIAVMLEVVVVLYAMSLGVEDETPLQWSFIFPGTSWNVTLAISSLFHLVPLSIVLTLVAIWAYMTRRVIVKPSEIRRGKISNVSKRAKRQRNGLTGRIASILSRNKGDAGQSGKVRFGRANVKGALIVLLVFSTLVLMMSLLAYPRLVHQAISSLYENNPSVLGFVKGVGAAAASIGAIFSSINDALLTAAPGLRDFVLSLGLVTAPLTSLDNVGKYLVFQNGAAWISAIIILLYGRYGRRGSQRLRR